MAERLPCQGLFVFMHSAQHECVFASNRGTGSAPHSEAARFFWKWGKGSEDAGKAKKKKKNRTGNRGFYYCFK